MFTKYLYHAGMGISEGKITLYTVAAGVSLK